MNPLLIIYLKNCLVFPMYMWNCWLNETLGQWWGHEESDLISLWGYINIKDDRLLELRGWEEWKRKESIAFCWFQFQTYNVLDTNAFFMDSPQSQTVLRFVRPKYLKIYYVVSIKNYLKHIYYFYERYERFLT